MTIQEFREDLRKRKTENEILKKQVSEIEEEMSQNVRKYGCVKDALKIIEGIALERRNKLKDGICNVVTETIKTLYGDEYRFDMSYEEKNNRSSLEMSVIREYEGNEVKRQMEGFGGGVADSVSVPLKMMVLKGSETGDILILDEAFKHADSDVVERVGEFLKEISNRLGIQVILITHHESILQYAEKGFHLVNNTGEVKVEKK